MTAPEQQPFLRSVLSGPDGQGSAGRVGALVVVLFACGWVTYLTIHEGKLPDLMPLTGWVTACVATLYGTNKVTALLGQKPGGAGE